MLEVEGCYTVIVAGQMIVTEIEAEAESRVEIGVEAESWTESVNKVLVLTSLLMKGAMQ